MQNDCLSLCLCSAQSYWTEWSEWGACSTTACDDVGIKVRHRKCVNSQPLPLLLVPACQGHHSERRECSTPPCTGENPKVYSSKDMKKICYSAGNDADGESTSMTLYAFFLCILNCPLSVISQVESLGTLGDVLSDMRWRPQD